MILDISDRVNSLSRDDSSPAPRRRCYTRENMNAIGDVKRAPDRTYDRLLIMRWLGALLVSLAVIAPGLVVAVPSVKGPRHDPRQVSELPTFVQRVEGAVVGLRVRAAEDGPSVATLGAQRFASGVIFDRRGFAVTVSYALLDAASIEARTRDDRTVPAQVVGIDLESGLGVVKLEGDGPWPVASLGQSRDAAPGALTGTVGVDEEGNLVWVASVLQSIRRFSAYWEYMLDRAFMVAPGSPSWGGSAVVDAGGNVIAIASLRLGPAPHVNLAIPLEKFAPVRDELIAMGRVVSRPPRPWLGLYTVEGDGGIVIDGFSPVGPARAAGLQKGDRIVGVNGVPVTAQAEFYEQLWRGRAGDVVALSIARAGAAARVIAVRSIDRRQLFRTTSP
jgi:S1-C subfamily serine protease